LAPRVAFANALAMSSEETLLSLSLMIGIELQATNRTGAQANRPTQYRFRESLKIRFNSVENIIPLKLPKESILMLVST
jgi:hypothetical protein